MSSNTNTAAGKKNSNGSKSQSSGGNKSAASSTPASTNSSNPSVKKSSNDTPAPSTSSPSNSTQIQPQNSQKNGESPSQPQVQDANATTASKPQENFWASRSQTVKTQQPSAVPAQGQVGGGNNLNNATNKQNEDDYLAKFGLNDSQATNPNDGSNQKQFSTNHRNEGSGQYYSDHRPQNLTLLAHFEGKGLNLAEAKRKQAATGEKAVEGTESTPTNKQEGNKRNPQQQAEDETPSKVLWVGNISNSVQESDLQQAFGVYGKINLIRVLHNRFCAFINFETEEAAKTAKAELNGTTISGSNVIVNFRKSETKPQNPSNNSNSAGSSNNNGNSSLPNLSSNTGGDVNQLSNDLDSMQINKPSKSLWIGNVSASLTEEDLRREFGVHGPIESVRLLKPKTCAFVNFKEPADAQKALNALQGKVLADLPIKINFGKKRASNHEQGYYGMMPYQMGMVPGYMEGFYPQGPFPGYPGYGQPYPGQGYPPTPMMYDPQMMYYNFVRCEVCGQDQKQVLFQPCMHATCVNCSKSENCPLCKAPIQKYLEISFAPPMFDPSMMVPPTFSPNNAEGNQRENAPHGQPQTGF